MAGGAALISEGGVDARNLRVLAVSNMSPTASEPQFGCFVQEQVDDLRAAGTSVDVVAFDGRRNRGEYLKACATVRAQMRRKEYDVVHAHYGLSGAVAL